MFFLFFPLHSPETKSRGKIKGFSCEQRKNITREVVRTSMSKEAGKMDQFLLASDLHTSGTCQTSYCQSWILQKKTRERYEPLRFGTAWVRNERPGMTYMIRSLLSKLWGWPILALKATLSIGEWVGNSLKPRSWCRPCFVWGEGAKVRMKCASLLFILIKWGVCVKSSPFLSDDVVS